MGPSWNRLAVHAVAMSDGARHTSSPAVARHKPWAVAHPTRSPVKLPGPSATTTPERLACPASPIRSAWSTAAVTAAAWRRPPRKHPVSGSPGRPSATLPNAVAVSMASKSVKLRALGTRLSGCSVCPSRTCSSGGGTRAPARSGHSITSRRASASSPGKSRSRRSSDGRTR